MRLIDFFEAVKQIGIPIIQTRDAAARLRISTSHASKLMGRLLEAGQVVKLSHGLWALSKKLDPYMLPEYLTAPMPSYISLQSALYFHGLISQIPTTIYAVSLGRTRVYQNDFGTFSIHHLQPSFYFGYVVLGENQVKMASPEKALIDLLYLSPARSRLFASLPEVDLSENFSVDKALEIIEKIESPKRRALVLARFNDLK